MEIKEILPDNFDIIEAWVNNCIDFGEWVSLDEWKRDSPYYCWWKIVDDTTAKMRLPFTTVTAKIECGSHYSLTAHSRFMGNRSIKRKECDAFLNKVWHSALNVAILSQLDLRPLPPAEMLYSQCILGPEKREPIPEIRQGWIDNLRDDLRSKENEIDAELIFRGNHSDYQISKHEADIACEILKNTHETNTNNSPAADDILGTERTNKSGNTE